MRLLRIMIFAIFIAILLPLTAAASQLHGDSVSAESVVGMPSGDSILAELAADPQTKFDYYYLEALKEQEKGNTTTAFELFRYCIELDSTSAVCHYMLGDYYYLLKDPDRWLHHTKRAVELSPRNIDYLDRLIKIYIACRDYPMATEMAERLIALDTDREDILELLVGLYNNQKEYDRAIKTLERLEILSGKSERISIAKSQLYNAVYNYEAAIAEIKALADEHPNDPNYRCIYAETLIDANKNEAAMAILNDILATNPDHLNTLTNLYFRYYANADDEMAEQMIKRVLLSNEKNDNLKISVLQYEIARNEEGDRDSTKICALLDTTIAAGKGTEAIMLFYCQYLEDKNMPQEKINEVLEKLLAIYPDNETARYFLTTSAWDRNDMHRVIELCADARRYNPEQMLFYYFQGLAYHRIGEKDLAIDALRNGISVINEDSPIEIVSDFYTIMGDLLHDKGLTHEAYAAYDSCLQWKPDNIGCLNNYAYFLSLEEKDLNKAEEMSHKAITAEPDNATYIDTYAWILFQQKRYEEAKVYIDDALKKGGDEEPTILEHAGDIHSMVGNTEKAVELWKQALVKDQNNKLLRKKINKRKYLKK